MQCTHCGSFKYSKKFKKTAVTKVANVISVRNVVVILAIKFVNLHLYKVIAYIIRTISNLCSCTLLCSKACSRQYRAHLPDSNSCYSIRYIRFVFCSKR